MITIGRSRSPPGGGAPCVAATGQSLGESVLRHSTEFGAVEPVKALETLRLEGLRGSIASVMQILYNCLSYGDK
jgi:hypothetical protein